MNTSNCANVAGDWQVASSEWQVGVKRETAVGNRESAIPRKIQGFANRET
ncbi:hypothetical protein GGD38_001386 [Chitinophagaceae bacterium OAS944]|nr:hypothetical protein [Chitinophagaceae bacterium OAS944]